MPADLNGKIYIITGTSSGIGTVIAYELAKRGAQVIAGNRNIEKALEAMAAIQTEQDDLSGFSTLALDVSSFDSVKKFAEKINAHSKIPHIDGLILNAGIMALPERKESVDGYEVSFHENVQ